ncbi:MAG: hypothetical protein NTW68_11835 [candidate division NC10 bacterium]|nr:hypothetical protein [candidate division NC10 bacterium]
MNAADIAAYIGAAAWLPQIGTWIHSYFVSPRVTIMPATEAEVGFTSMGPIFNIRMAFSADRKSAILDGLDLVLKHADGESRLLRWVGLYVTLSEIRDEAGKRQIASRDETPVALKIGTESLVERVVRFQEPRYHESVRPLLNNLVAHFNFLKQSGDTDYVGKVLSSKECYEMLEARKSALWWKAGRYDIEVRLGSPSKVALTKLHCFFELTPVDVENLRRNLDTLDAELRNVINSNVPESKPEPVNWNWANVGVRRAG